MIWAGPCSCLINRVLKAQKSGVQIINAILPFFSKGKDCEVHTPFKLMHVHRNRLIFKLMGMMLKSTR